MRRFLFALAAIAVVALACGPDFRVAVFSYKRHPDFPRSAFVDGHLGVLQPTFARSYLVIAFRYFNGIGMTSGEREQARDYYKDRETGHWDRSGTDWPARWQSLRARIANPPAPAAPLVTGGQMAYDPETHSFALNCAEDAYRIAIHTLEARRATPAFRSWLHAQDQVFASCSGDPSIPADPSPTDRPLARADRAYQIAAAHFYSRHYAEALDRFRRISRDPSSPWQPISRYLVVRTLLRMTEDTKTATAAGAQLNTESAAILADASLSRIHGMTWNLVTREKIRDRDHDYFRSLAQLLSSGGQENGLRETLWNYTDLYDNVVAADPAPFRDADLSDWIFCFQSRDTSQLPHSLARWKQTRSAAWMLAALSHSDAGAAAASGLLAAAEAVPEAAPAYLTARFHLLRLYEEAGNRTAARDAVTALLSSPALRSLPSSANLFRGLGMLAAPSFREFLSLAVRRPVLLTWDSDVAETPAFFGHPQANPAVSLLDADATRVLNRETPFRLLKETALGDALPASLRREALLTTFTRGLMLDEDLSELAKAIPEAAPYLSESTPDGRRFAAAFFLLRQPEARPYFGSGITRQTRPGRIDNFRDNWWCPMDIKGQLDSRANGGEWYDHPSNALQRATDPLAPAFLTAADSHEARRQFDRLARLGPGPDFLGAVVLRYAASHREDPRVPEALHLVVRSGRYGCGTRDTWKTTRAAFRALHLRYPRSEWTRRTPTWFRL